MLKEGTSSASSKLMASTHPTFWYEFYALATQSQSLSAAKLTL